MKLTAMTHMHVLDRHGYTVRWYETNN